MQQKAVAQGATLRPHFKTHHSAQVATWFKAMGIQKAAVSSSKMAHYFAQHGWDDILLAFPLNLREASTIAALNEQIQLTALLVSETPIPHLEKVLSKPLSVMIEIDTGYGRTGIAATDFPKIDALLKRIAASSKLIFRGFQIHNGHTYLKDSTTIAEIHSHALSLLKALRLRYTTQFPNLSISLGDTPSCSMLDDFSEIDEMRPGNFVFYDLVQWQTGSCSLSDIALALAAPIVFKNADNLTVTVHGGAVHLSKDFVIDAHGEKCFGLPVALHEQGWDSPIEGGNVRSLSQEHGTISLPEAWFHQFQEGDLIGILPAHACLAAQLHNNYRTTEGETFTTMRSDTLAPATSQLAPNMPLK